MDKDILRWKELAHRAIDDIFSSGSGQRMYPDGPLSEQELAEFNELDKKLGYLSKKVIDDLNKMAKESMENKGDEK
jgi:hypothetical protein